MELPEQKFMKSINDNIKEVTIKFTFNYLISIKWQTFRYFDSSTYYLPVFLYFVKKNP